MFSVKIISMSGPRPQVEIIFTENIPSRSLTYLDNDHTLDAISIETTNLIFLGLA